MELRRQNRNGSIESIIRDLISKDRQEWAKEKEEGTSFERQTAYTNA